MKKNKKSLWSKFMGFLSPFRMGESDYYQDQSDFTLGAANPIANFILISSILFVAAIGYWLSTSEIDEFARGNATVVAATGVKEIESLEGGIVREILVNEGDVVKAGDVLVKLDDTKFQGVYKEKASEILILKAIIKRLEAELEHTPLVFGKEFSGASLMLLKNQEALYKSRMKNLDLETEMIKDRILEKEEEIKSLKSSLEYKSKNVKIISDRLEKLGQMVEKGYYPKVKFLEVQMNLNDAKSKESTLESKIQEEKTELNRLKRNLEDIANDFKQDIYKELEITQAKLDRLSHSSKHPKGQAKRMELTSPIDGVVKNLSIDAPEQIVRPGELVMEIVPLSDPLVIEAKIMPKDIGFIKPGQKANVKISAYSYLTFGTLEGTVDKISASSFTGNPGERDYFKVTIKTDKNYLGKDPANKISIGMTGIVDILTYKKTILDYILKPLYRAKEETLRL